MVWVSEYAEPEKEISSTRERGSALVYSEYLFGGLLGICCNKEHVQTIPDNPSYLAGRVPN